MKNFGIFGVLLIMILMIVKPEYYLASTTRGLTLFATSVLPAVFPFLFFSTLLTYIGGAESISRLFKKPARKLFNSPDVGAYVMFTSFTCGYPTGAATTCSLYQQGYLSTDEVKRIIAFASTSGPIFMLGTVAAIFDNHTVGLIVTSSHYLSAIVNGIIWRGKKPSQSALMQFTPPIDNAIGDAVTKSTLAMLAVGGYVVLGTLIIDSIALIPGFTECPQILTTVIFGIVEMTRGVTCAGQINSFPLSIALSSGIVSLGGLSILLQSHYFLSKCGVKFRQLLARKITQTVLAFSFSIIFSVILAF